VTVRKNGGEQEQQRGHLVREWDPFRMMRSLFRDPFGEMSLLPQMERGLFSPAFEVKETTDAYLFSADLPGVKESDIEVSLTGNRLTISGKRESEKEDKGDAYYVYERSYGDFTRSFTLPGGVDPARVAANLDKGVLTVSLGKKPEVQTKKIAIGSEKSRS
jgi:HSP20 family protein